ncbi:MAG: hypothetical protein OXD31_16185 [Chloroflexi bacterium]|nr:hypothetical protein [Chloroflexota bacterium]
MTTYTTANYYIHIATRHVLKRTRVPPARGDPVMHQRAISH